MTDRKGKRPLVTYAGRGRRRRGDAAAPAPAAKKPRAGPSGRAFKNCTHARSNAAVNIDKCLQRAREPARWHCDDCRRTTGDAVWTCLACGHAGCERDGTSAAGPAGSGRAHALKHHEATAHPLAMDFTTGAVHCYACEEYVLQDSAWGDIAQLRRTIKEVRTQRP